MSEADLTIPDLCLRTGFSYPQVYRLLLTGRVTGRRDGGRWLICRKSADRLAKTLDRERAAAV